MSCLSFKITPTGQASLALGSVAGAALAVACGNTASLAVAQGPTADLHVQPQKLATVDVTPLPRATLSIRGICSVSPGDLYVLGAGDEPLRTSDGGYILLDPDGEHDNP